jgi:hypothetical protein
VRSRCCPCVCVCVCVSPLSLLGNGSVEDPLSLLGNGSVEVPLSLLGNGYVFYAVRTVSRESRQLVLPRTSCFLFRGLKTCRSVSTRTSRSSCSPITELPYIYKVFIFSGADNVCIRQNLEIDISSLSQYFYIYSYTTYMKR